MSIKRLVQEFSVSIYIKHPLLETIQVSTKKRMDILYNVYTIEYFIVINKV